VERSFQLAVGLSFLKNILRDNWYSENIMVGIILCRVMSRIPRCPLLVAALLLNLNWVFNTRGQAPPHRPVQSSNRKKEPPVLLNIAKKPPQQRNPPSKQSRDDGVTTFAPWNSSNASSKRGIHGGDGIPTLTGRLPLFLDGSEDSLLNLVGKVEQSFKVFVYPIPKNAARCNLDKGFNSRDGPMFQLEQQFPKYLKSHKTVFTKNPDEADYFLIEHEWLCIRIANAATMKVSTRNKY
jgi:hypothetical protein